jgi:hypothetical protein
LQKFLRRRKWEEIIAENNKISSRIERVSGMLSMKRLELEFQEREKYKQLGCKMRLLELAERVAKVKQPQSQVRSKTSLSPTKNQSPETPDIKKPNRHTPVPYIPQKSP